MTWIKSLISSLILLTAALPLKGENVDSVSRSRPVLSSYNFEIGGTRALSTYLSPLFYEGTSFAVSGSWTKAFNRWSDRCAMRFEAAVNYDDMLNPAKTAAMLGLTARFGWGLLWKKTFAPDWSLTLGPMLDIYGGVLYLPRNGNNPVSALASVGIAAAGSVSWKTRFGKFPVIIADEVSVPSLSGFFCPGFGESYYEIYLGNRKDLVHFGWWGNAFGINNLLSVKINFGKTGMTVGYRFDLRYFKANSLENQVMRNAFVIGVIPNGF